MSIDLPLAHGLTGRVQQACQGLEQGKAPLLDHVTGVTAELLKWWFQDDFVDQRQPINFHEGQRQGILNVIYAHEVLQTTTLSHLYQQIAPDILKDEQKASVIEADKNAHPKYCLKMATGTGKTWVLQALMIWQLLNANRDQDNPLYTRHFLIVTPGLIVYDRLLDAFQGKERNRKRSFEDSEIYQFRSLFIPETYRDEVFQFVRSSFCVKEDIGRKGGGLIAVTNWQAIKEDSEVEDDDIDPPEGELDPKAVVQDILPLTPGTSAGNDLYVLNRQFERGNVLNFLRDIPDLLVFNDEAHRIHDVKKEGEVTEVEWQKSLIHIAEPKGKRFIQIDFTATPYNQVRIGKNARRSYFPHIIVDFDLKTAMKAGLVKSLVLDKRSKIGALDNDELEFKAERDDDGKPVLSEGQQIMLRAGLTRLSLLEKDFTALDPDRHPKMLIICEDTAVAPLVEAFLTGEGLSKDEILRVDSNRKGELKKNDWANLRERLFDLDRHKNPRIVISILMLREGFDVNNICVIVPLRSTQARILLEQTIGRGLRLMWRGLEFEDQKQENRQRIRLGKAPSSMIDVLSIIEHPAFQSFYDELMDEGLAGEPDDDRVSSTGDLIAVDRREDYEEYDFAVPFILREREEEIKERSFDIMALGSLGPSQFDSLKKFIGKGEEFYSEDVEYKTRIDRYRVEGGMLTATGYNDFISKLVYQISHSLSQPISRSSTSSADQCFPYMQIDKPQLAALIDDYIRTRLFGHSMNPMDDENWRVLPMVVKYIVEEVSKELLRTEATEIVAEAEVRYRRLSEVPRLIMRESHSCIVSKCIYSRLSYPSRYGGLEQSFIEMADRDASVEAFCKIHEQKHDFAHLPYIKEDGLPAFYCPDFFVRTAGNIYLVETKAQGQLNHPNIKRKKKAAMAWCERINNLAADQRSNRAWCYVLLGESTFYEWQDDGGDMATLLHCERLRQDKEKGQPSLAF